MGSEMCIRDSIAYYYYYDEDDPVIALAHIQRACQLDSRIAKKNPLLALCYKKLGEWEKSVAAYQGLDWIHYFENQTLISAQNQIYKLHKGYYFGKAKKLKVYDVKEERK